MHEIDDLLPLEEYFEFLNDDLEEDKQEAKEKFKFIYFLYKDALTLLRLSRGLGGDSEQEKQYLETAVDAVSEVSRLANFPGEEKEVNLIGVDTFKVLVEDLNEIGQEWLVSFYLAVIVRDSERLKNILSLPVDVLKLGSGTTATDYRFLWFKLCARFFSEGMFDRDIYEKMVEIRDKNISLVVADPANRENLNNVYLNAPIAEAMKHLSEENEEAFGRSLEKALEAHENYWGQTKSPNPGGTPLCRDESGFIAFSCTALAALAYDKQWKIVDSDYMPRGMVDGSYSLTSD